MRWHEHYERCRCRNAPTQKNQLEAFLGTKAPLFVEVRSECGGLRLTSASASALLGFTRPREPRGSTGHGHSASCSQRRAQQPAPAKSLQDPPPSPEEKRKRLTHPARPTCCLVCRWVCSVHAVHALAHAPPFLARVPATILLASSSSSSSPFLSLLVCDLASSPLSLTRKWRG